MKDVLSFAATKPNRFVEPMGLTSLRIAADTDFTVIFIQSIFDKRTTYTLSAIQ
ncbi:hypothetical protein D515_03541 [Grimontia indica]|uniref:Uncharacterized protein n=1 Tax=Grimontia indica TaxID=1056512 RepID=R1GNL8_9GAMM|nr:hypothetical protein D515_03541 [Grimontia indica]